MPKREPFSGVDTAWLRMERPSNPMTIVGVMALDKKLTLARLKSIIESRFLRHRRFQQRVVMDGDSAYWERDARFDLSFHVKRTALPRPGGKQELYDLVSDLASTPLDFSRPPWQFHLVDSYHRGSAVIARIHHCYADGIALIRVLLSLTGEAVPGDGSPESGMDEDDEGLLARLIAPVSRTVSDTLSLGSSLVGAYIDVILNPSHALGYARQGLDVAAEATRLALMPMDSPTRFKGTPTGRKRVAWTEPLALDEIKPVAHATGCSVNDLLLSCVAGALRAYLIEKGDDVEDVELRAVVPVNMRPETETEALGNYFGLVAVLLPIGIENPLERLYEIKRRMLALKSSSQAEVTYALLAAVGKGPKAIQQQILDLLSSRASAVMTNVPGPQTPLFLGGAKLTEIVFWVPQSGDIGMGISMLSYNGGVQFGIVTDCNLVEDPDSIARLFASQFEQVLLGTLMSSWDGPPDPDEVGSLLSE